MNFTSRRANILLPLVLSLIFALAPSEYSSADPTDAITGANSIVIQADQMEASRALSLITFTGNVVVRDGTSTLYSERLQVTYTEEQQISNIVAEGALRIVQGDRIAYADRGTYDADTKQAILTGNARVDDGSNSVSGDQITLLLDQEMTIIDSGANQRVRATIPTQPQKGTP